MSEIVSNFSKVPNNLIVPVTTVFLGYQAIKGIVYVFEKTAEVIKEYSNKEGKDNKDKWVLEIKM